MGHAHYLAERASRIQQIKVFFEASYPDKAEITLEIGCGHGHYLVAYAQQHPEINCLGVDLVTKRILKAGIKAGKRQLRNLHFLKADIRELLEAWPQRLIVTRVFILFPDPWPKKRHVKNRVIQEGLLDQLGTCARPGTPLHFRTDHEGQFAWGLELMASHPHWQLRDDWEWPFENPSYFQDLLGKYQSLTAVYVPEDAY